MDSARHSFIGLQILSCNDYATISRAKDAASQRLQSVRQRMLKYIPHCRTNWRDTVFPTF